MVKVALITGGASGMGLAVAEALAKREEWHLHLLDLNEKAGTAAASSLPNTTFHKNNVNSYPDLASTFDKIFKDEGQIDFVFANAGIVERDNFYEKHEQSPPPEPNQLSVDIDLKSVINTTYLAQHYFRLSPHKGKDANLIMTASCGGLYPSSFCPMYSAAKHGVVGLMRSVYKSFWANDGVRVNCICPGTVRTNLLDSEAWGAFPDEYFTPVSKIVDVVVKLIDGGVMQDSWGGKTGAEGPRGQAVEVNGPNHYFRPQHDWCDNAMKNVMAATEPADDPTQDKRFVKTEVVAAST